MSGHTPGPWVIDRDNEVIEAGLFGKQVVIVFELGRNTADWPLLAAAPDLLAALKALMADSFDTLSVIEQAEAAIAKAEGR